MLCVRSYIGNVWTASGLEEGQQKLGHAYPGLMVLKASCGEDAALQELFRYAEDGHGMQLAVKCTVHNMHHERSRLGALHY